MKIDSDIDIDLADRSKLLEILDHIPAAIRKDDSTRKHNTGVYVTPIPYDPIQNMAALDYKEADDRGYFKLDLLNVHVYNKIKTESHLQQLMKEPDWSMLQDKNTVEKLIHISRHYHTIMQLPEPIDSITRLAMFLALIRPAKKHLIGKTWKEVNNEVWEKDDDGYAFKKAHGIAYAHLVVVHMNLLKEESNEFEIG